MADLPMDGMGVTRVGVGEAGRFLLIWSVMVAAMMLPSAMPMPELMPALIIEGM